MTARTYTTEQVVALLEQQQDFEDEQEDEGSDHLNEESDDDGVSSPQGDFTYVDGTQSLVNSDLLMRSSSSLIDHSLEPAEMDSILLLDPDLNNEDSLSGQ